LGQGCSNTTEASGILLQVNGGFPESKVGQAKFTHRHEELLFRRKVPNEYVFVDSLGDLLNAVRSGFVGFVKEESNNDQQNTEIVPETDCEEGDTSDEEREEWDDPESETDPESESEFEFVELFWS
jgi:hypothetical protein